MSVKQQQLREAVLEAEGIATPLYAPREKIYPQSVKGRIRRIKWALLIVTLGTYYFLPFVRWYRGPGEPSQAMLVDLVHRRFYFFSIEIWPQEVYYITGLLILAAVGLFLMNAIAGRLWCGYLCPQTVWTDLFFWIERIVEGDRRERMLKAKQKLNLERIKEKIIKHSLWLLIAWWTGGAWVLYFADAPTLVGQLATFHADAIAYVWIGILTFTTYFLAGHMREQLCTFMCPWPRIQAALIDETALEITYRYDRGEPRGSAKKNMVLRKAGRPAGDCIDCRQCINVCPNGVDIRQGLQLDCIQCGLCMDACDTVMEKIGRPTGLIAYDTDVNVKRRLEGRPELPVRVVRPRTILYVTVIVLVGALMLYSLATRSSVGIAALHDRNPMFVELSDGAIRNAYTVRILNKNTQTHSFSLEVAELPAAHLEVIGATQGTDGSPVIAVEPDQTFEARALVTLPAGAQLDKEQDITFVLVDLATGARVTARDNFFAP